MPVLMRCVYVMCVVGPSSKDVMFRVTESGSNTYKVEYTPVVPGYYSRLALLIVN